MLVLATFVIVVAGMKAAATILVPFLVAVFLTVLCAPILMGMTRRGIPEWLGLTVILTVLLVCTGFVLVVVGSSLTSFAGNLDAYESHLGKQFDRLDRWLQVKFDIYTESEAAFARSLDPQDAFGYIGEALAQLSGVLGNATFILMMFAFMLAETRVLLTKARRLSELSGFPFEEVEELGQDIVRYFAIKTWVSLGTGVTLGLLYWMIGIDAVILWAFIGFVLNFVPSIGSFLAAIPPLLLTVAQEDLDLSDTGLLLLGVVAINTGFGNILEPRVMGRGLNLSTTVVFLSLLFWGWVLGPIGMLLSVPLTVACKLALDLDPHTRGFAFFLGAR